MKPFNQDEREFLKAVGLEPDQLEQLTQNAPPAPADAQARIRAMARRKAGLEAAPAEMARSTVTAPAAAPPRTATRPWTRRWLPAAAALLLAMGGTLAVAGSPTAQAALERLLHLIPGVGITETSRETLVLAGPVTVQGARGDLTVIALVGKGEQTEVRFRVDGLATTKSDLRPVDSQPLRAALVLPDGTRLQMISSGTGAGLHDVKGTLWFPALPEDIRSVTLELPSIHGVTDAYSVPLSLVDIGSAGLTQPVAGGWSKPRHGVTLGAPHVAHEQDQIVLSLQGVLEHEGAHVDRMGGYERDLITLADNLGHAYPLLLEESSLNSGSGRGLAASFAGPVSAGATSLRLTVPFILVQTGGEARLRVPLSQLPMGQPAELNKLVRVGAHTVTVRSVTRLSDERFALDLDLGPEQEGAVLKHVTVTPFRSSGGSSYRMDPDGKEQVTGIEVSYTPSGRYLDLQFARPILHIEGPWVIELPVR